MSCVPSTLWYNGDWDLSGIPAGATGSCMCAGIENPDNCVSRPPNEVMGTLLMGTYSDVLVTNPTGWRITSIFSNNFTLMDSSDVATIVSANYEIRSDVADNDGGILITSGTISVTKVPTGRTVVVGLDTYTEYTFTVTLPTPVIVPQDRYWVNVAPIIPDALVTLYGTSFLLFNSTTNGLNAIGIPPGNNANDFVGIGNPDPDDNFVPSTFFGPEFHDFSNGVIGCLIPVCIHPDMEVCMQDGTTKILKNLMEGDLLRTINIKTPARVMVNHKNHETHKRLVRMDPNSIKPNVPDKVLLITTNHNILVDGRYRKPCDLINNNTIAKRKIPKAVHTYTIVTDNGLPVMINNVAVATWSYDSWTGKHMDK